MVQARVGCSFEVYLIANLWVAETSREFAEKQYYCLKLNNNSYYNNNLLISRIIRSNNHGFYIIYYMESRIKTLFFRWLIIRKILLFKLKS